MKEVTIKNHIGYKRIFETGTIFRNDIENLSASFIPGEWCRILWRGNQIGVGYINLQNQRDIVCRFVEKRNKMVESDNEEEVASQILQKNIFEAINRRGNNASNARLVYGQADRLPGLIVDAYRDCIIIQITTAGIDRFRKDIRSLFENSFVGKKAQFFDRPSVREVEYLPQYEQDKFLETIHIEENGFEYKITSEVMQKNGYYYDHRDNRARLEKFIMRDPSKYQNGLDLYCYIGSWGMHLLRAGIQKVDFVDQAEVGSLIENNLSANNLENVGSIYKKDVNRFLDTCIKEERSFDVIVCDPPAFSKEKKNLRKAKDGYARVYKKIMKIINNGGIVAAASCTHGISFEDLAEVVAEAANTNNLQVRIQDVGVQGQDHPFSTFGDAGFYIKYILFSVEKMGD